MPTFCTFCIIVLSIVHSSLSWLNNKHFWTSILATQSAWVLVRRVERSNQSKSPVNQWLWLFPDWFSSVLTLILKVRRPEWFRRPSQRSSYSTLHYQRLWLIQINTDVCVLLPYRHTQRQEMCQQHFLCNIGSDDVVHKHWETEMKIGLASLNVVTRWVHKCWEWNLQFVEHRWHNVSFGLNSWSKTCRDFHTDRLNEPLSRQKGSEHLVGKRAYQRVRTPAIITGDMLELRADGLTFAQKVAAVTLSEHQ